jgi:hypothetical protein
MKPYYCKNPRPAPAWLSLSPEPVLWRTEHRTSARLNAAMLSLPGRSQQCDGKIHYNISHKINHIQLLSD